MEQEKINIWNEAGKSGLVLGLVSILYLVITSLVTKLGATGGMAFLIGLLDFILWAAKLFICIWLMRTFMLRFSAANPSADNRKVFKFGMVTALYSALLFSAFYLVYVLYINPEALTASFDSILGQYSGMVDSATLEAMENMESDLPTISFFTNLIWCWLFGTILSAIFSKKIPSRSSDPFKDQQQ